MAMVTKVMWVDTGMLSVSDYPIPFWGFASIPIGRPQLPGPVIEAEAGDTVNIWLVSAGLVGQGVDEDLSLAFKGQSEVRYRRIPGPSWSAVSPEYSEGTMISLTNRLRKDMDIAIGYRFTADRCGTFLYESATSPEIQVQMGLFGALVVRPNGWRLRGHPNYRTAYGASTQSSYNVEALLVFSEIDSQMHSSVNTGNNYNMLEFRPDEWLVNGRSYPKTLDEPDDSSQPVGSRIESRVGQRVLLRIVNAGVQFHTVCFGGLIGRVVAIDSNPLSSPAADATYEKTGMAIGPGHTCDVVLEPATVGTYLIYDRDYNHLVSRGDFPGGMMTQLDVTP